MEVVIFSVVAVGMWIVYSISENQIKTTAIVLVEDLKKQVAERNEKILELRNEIEDLKEEKRELKKIS